MKSYKYVLLIIVLTLTSLPVFAQKMAFVHSQKIVAEFEEFKEAENKIATIRQQYQTEYNNLLSEYEALLKEIESQSLLLSPEKKQEKEQLLQAKGLQIEKYKFEKLGPQGDLYKKQAELVQPIYDKVSEVITQIGEDEGYDFIFDGATGLLFAKPESDITQQVLDALNKDTGAAVKK